MTVATSVNRLDYTKMAAARTKLISARTPYGMPYLAQAVFALIVVECTELPTLGVDAGWRCYCNPDFVDRVTVDQLAGALGHEVGHLLRDSAGRGRSIGVGERSQARWNIACDLGINLDLRANGVPLPPRALFPEVFGLAPGLSAEEYFVLLEAHDPHTRPPAEARSLGSNPAPEPDRGGEPSGSGSSAPDASETNDSDQDARSPGEGANCGSCTGGRARPWEQAGQQGPDAALFDEVVGRISEATGTLIRRAVAKEVLSANSKRPGSVPSGMVRWADDLVNPQLDWRKLLAGHVASAVQYVTGQHDYTYRRPSRRGNPDGVIQPSMRRPVPDVAVVVDTSGSMGQAELANCVGELKGIIQATGVHARDLRVLSCDAVVHTVERVMSVRSLNLAGGGGTDMREGIAAAVGLRPRPSVIIVLTDGYTPWPATKPRAPVIVGIIGDQTVATPAWAKTVHIPLAALKRKSRPR